MLTRTRPGASLMHHRIIPVSQRGFRITLTAIRNPFCSGPVPYRHCVGLAPRLSGNTDRSGSSPYARGLTLSQPHYIFKAPSFPHARGLTCGGERRCGPIRVSHLCGGFPSLRTVPYRPSPGLPTGAGLPLARAEGRAFPTSMGLAFQNYPNVFYNKVFPTSVGLATGTEQRLKR